MNRRFLIVPLAAVLCAAAFGRAGAQTADNALAAGYAGAASAASAALKDQRALAVKPAAKAAAAASDVREFRLASNDSNSPEIYRQLVASGAKRTCTSERSDDDGFPRTREACSVVGRLDRVTVYRNEIIWHSTQVVKVAGEMRCRQEWIAQGGVHRRPAQLWHFCDFRGVVEP